MATVDRAHHPKGCWLWTGYILDAGYGQIKIRYVNYRAHRVAFYLHCGRQPVGIIMHDCDVRSCCNPDHLIDGTNAENSADMVAKGRSHKPIGELHANRKLTRKQALEIRASTGTCVVVGEKYGISSSMVSHIRTGKSWNEELSHA